MPCSASRSRGGLLLLEPDEAHLEARGVVAGEPPGEEARDPVDARARHPELVADVEDGDGHQDRRRPRLTRAPSRPASADGEPREAHTTAPESERRTMSPAPDEAEGERALAR